MDPEKYTEICISCCWRFDLEIGFRIGVVVSLFSFGRRFRYILYSFLCSGKKQTDRDDGREKSLKVKINKNAMI